MTPEEFREAGHRLVDWIADYVESIEERAVTPDVEPGDVLACCPNTLPTRPESFSTVLGDVDRIVVPGLVHWQHPSFFAYFPANSSYARSSATCCRPVGVNGMSWVTSPACTELELRVVDWMAELLDLPAAVPQHQRERWWSHPGHGERSNARRRAVGTLAGDRGRRQRRR